MGKYNFDLDWVVEDSTYNVEVLSKGNLWYIRNIKIYKKVNKLHKLLNRICRKSNINLGNISLTEKIALIDRIEMDLMFCYKVYLMITEHRRNMQEFYKGKEVDDKL